MRSRLVIYIVIAVVAVAALVAGIVAVAGASQTNPLPAVSATDLLAQMHQHRGQTTSVSGDVSWQNNLLGDLSSLTGSGFGGASAKLPLVASGSGRLWAGKDGVRVESQASGGDQVVVMSSAGHDAWTYDYAANTAVHYVMSGAPAGDGQPAREPSASAATPAQITAFLEQLAPYAKVAVTGQATVAGRDAYLVSMTPVASDTALGSVQAAIDGQTYTPLRLQVFARGDTTPVLQFGFTSVSYDPIPAATFTFTPPAGTTVTTKTIDLGKTAQGGSSSGAQSEPTKAQQSALQQILRNVFLTVPEAQKLVQYKLYSPQGYSARPFQQAMVLDKGGPLTAMGEPLTALLEASGFTMPGSPAGAGDTTSPTVATGPVTVLVYGKGFGTIVLAQTQTTAALDKQLKQLPALVDSTTVNGVTVRSLTTPLGGVEVWQKGDTTLIAGGMVPAADLQAFVTSVQ